MEEKILLELREQYKKYKEKYKVAVADITKHYLDGVLLGMELMASYLGIEL